MAEKTTVSLKTSDFGKKFGDHMDPSNLSPLEAELKKALSSLHVSKVKAEILAGGKAIKLILEAPGAVDPAAVKHAIR